MVNWSRSSLSLVDGVQVNLLVNEARPSSHSLIFLHGLGDSGESFEFIPEYLTKGSSESPFANFRFLLPTAPTAPVTLNGGFPSRSWFDIFGLSESSPEDLDGIDRAADTLWRLVDREVENGIPEINIFFGGFSQGGAVAYRALLNKPERHIGGSFHLSTWFPGANAAGDLGPHYFASKRVFWSHGESDAVVATDLGKKSAAFIKRHGAETKGVLSRNLGHSFDEKILKAWADWMLVQGCDAVTV